MDPDLQHVVYVLQQRPSGGLGGGGGSGEGRPRRAHAVVAGHAGLTARALWAEMDVID